MLDGDGAAGVVAPLFGDAASMQIGGERLQLPTDQFQKYQEASLDEPGRILIFHEGNWRPAEINSGTKDGDSTVTLSIFGVRRPLRFQKSRLKLIGTTRPFLNKPIKANPASIFHRFVNDPEAPLLSKLGDPLRGAPFWEWMIQAPAFWIVQA